MEIFVDNQIQGEYDPDIHMPMIEKVILGTLSVENFRTDVEISISFVDDQTIHELNKKFREIDKPTDVLSFPLLDFVDGVCDYDEYLETDLLAIGDIVVSIETVKRQAELYGHSFERELGFMIAHSMLHLLGHDHMKEEEEKVMMLKQEKILQDVGLFR